MSHKKNQKSVIKDAKNTRPYALNLMKIMVGNYYELQKARIQMSNRIAMLQRDYKLPEKEGKILHENMDLHLKKAEEYIQKELKFLIRQFEFSKWIINVKGIGVVITAGLMSGIEDIKRFDTISKLWKYCGQAPGQKRKRGQKIDFNPFLKTLLWKLGEGFVKSKGPYRKLYDEFRAQEEKRNQPYQTNTKESAGLKLANHPDNAGCGLSADTNITKQNIAKIKEPKIWVIRTDGHVYARAKRKTIKIFLSHLWQTWRKFDGLETKKTYVEQHLKHDNIIPVPEEYELPKVI